MEIIPSLCTQQVEHCDKGNSQQNTEELLAPKWSKFLFLELVEIEFLNMRKNIWAFFKEILFSNINFNTFSHKTPCCELYSSVTE